MSHNELRGVIHGRTIVLDEEPGLPDGTTVAVRVNELHTAVESVGSLPPVECRHRSAGCWKDDDAEGLDEYLRTFYEQRQVISPK